VAESLRLANSAPDEQQQVAAAQGELERAKNTLLKLLRRPVEARLTLTDHLNQDLAEVESGE
jgi:hypothetical protein